VAGQDKRRHSSRSPPMTSTELHGGIEEAAQNVKHALLVALGPRVTHGEVVGARKMIALISGLLSDEPRRELSSEFERLTALGSTPLLSPFCGVP
jgi:hypothetical protein